jgi:transposase
MMVSNPGIHVLTDEQWAALEPLIDEVRPHSKVAHANLRQTIEAIFCRHQNGAKWRSLPNDLGPWWKAAQTFIRWARLGVWERLLERAQQRGIALGMTFIDGTSIRAHPKASVPAKSNHDICCAAADQETPWRTGGSGCQGCPLAMRALAMATSFLVQATVATVWCLPASRSRL